MRRFSFYGALIPAIAVFFSMMCGGFNAEMAHMQGGFFDVEKVFPGRRIGYALVRDRNENVRGSALLEQVCSTENGIHGRCQTRLLEGSIPFPTPEEFIYKTYHEDNLDVSVSFESGATKQNGIVRGDHLILRGHKRMPGGNSDVSVETRFHKIAGPPGTLMQIEIFSRWGIQVGSVITTWIPAS